MLGPTFNLTAVIALIAAALLIATGTLHLHLDKDSGLVAATLLGGAGWFGRELYQDTRRRRAVCQAYAAIIETTCLGFWASLSNEELDRHLNQVAPSVRAGTGKPTLTAAEPDILDMLPDLRVEGHLLAPTTVRTLYDWIDRTRSLQQAYKFLGTQEFCQIEHARLAPYVEWVKRFRREHEAASYAALRQIRMTDTAIAIPSAFLRRLADAVRQS